MQRSRIVAAMIAALGIVGIGVGAAVAGGGSSADAPGQVKKATTTTTAPAAEEAMPAMAVDGQGGQGVVRSTEGCNGGTYRNHGEFVKTVAHRPGRTAAEVVAAAQSPCGRPIGATDDKVDVEGGPPAEHPGKGGPPQTRPGQGTPGGPQGSQGQGPPADKPGRGPK